MNLRDNISKLHITYLGNERIKKNLGIDGDTINYCKKIIMNDGTKIDVRGKNYYVRYQHIEIVVNASSYTVITAHIR